MYSAYTPSEKGSVSINISGPEYKLLLCEDTAETIKSLGLYKGDIDGIYGEPVRVLYHHSRCELVHEKSGYLLYSGSAFLNNKLPLIIYDGMLSDFRFLENAAAVYSMKRLTIIDKRRLASCKKKVHEPADYEGLRELISEGCYYNVEISAIAENKAVNETDVSYQELNIILKNSNDITKIIEAASEEECCRIMKHITLSAYERLFVENLSTDATAENIKTDVLFIRNFIAVDMYLKSVKILEKHIKSLTEEYSAVILSESDSIAKQALCTEYSRYAEKIISEDAGNLYNSIMNEWRKVR